MASVRPFILPTALCLLLAAATSAAAQSGSTLSPDRLSYMVNKDLAGERWTINLNLAAVEPRSLLNATGNVFKPDGSPPVFVLCQIREDSTGNLEDPSSVFRLSCQGADACPTTATECAQSSWSLIATDVPIPASFFLPPGGNGAAAVAASGAPVVPATAGLVARALAHGRALWSQIASLLSPPTRLADLGPRDAFAQAAPRGATLTYDGFNYLVNKDLAGERWSISLNLVPVATADGTFRNEISSLTGNVFKPDGSAPSFIHCETRADSTGTLDDLGSTFRFSCQGASACTDTANGCAGSAWTLLSDDIALPASFLLPPGGLPATPQSDPEIVVIGRTSDPPSVISTDYQLVEDAAGVAAGIGTTSGATCPVERACEVRIGGCDDVPGVVVRTDGGVCGCRIANVPSACITCGDGATGTCGGGCAYPVGTRGLTARGVCLPQESGSGDCSCYAIGAGRRLEVESCGGTVRARCPGQRCCVDDPRDGCDAAGGLDCPGICVLGGTCPDPQPDCVDASGDYTGTSTVSGTCNSGTVTLPINETGASSFRIVQAGCAIQARADGEAFATGRVEGNQITATGSSDAFPFEGCSSVTSSQQLSGTLVGDQLELSGPITTSASCDVGEISCSFETTVSASR